MSQLKSTPPATLSWAGERTALWSNSLGDLIALRQPLRTDRRRAELKGVGVLRS